jgi:hypothetical protein
MINFLLHLNFVNLTKIQPISRLFKMKLTFSTTVGLAGLITWLDLLLGYTSIFLPIQC